MTTQAKQAAAPMRFTKRKLITMAQYRKYIDLLSILLQDTARYSLEETDKQINRFMKGKVR